MARAKENVMIYNGYHGSVEFSLEDNILFGRVLYIRDVVAYEGSALDELRRAFVEAVDNYLAECREEGLSPNKTFSGTFNVRVSSELHQRAAIEAECQGISMNKYIEDAVRAKVNGHYERVLIDRLERPVGFSTIGDKLQVQGKMIITISPVGEYPVAKYGDGFVPAFVNNAVLGSSTTIGTTVISAKARLPELTRVME